VNLLLDTHIAIWVVSNPIKLSAQAQALIVDPENVAHVSIASIWEIAIKNSLSRKANLPFGVEQALEEFQLAGLQLLPIRPAHLVAVEGLRGLHRDPFDRLLIAQAQVEPMRLVTSDRAFSGYSDTVILV
jgi:PIN domain nuclease of toxin-antitoxin system